MKTSSGPNATGSNAAPVIRHGFYNTKSGKRRRHRCGACGKTLRSPVGTPHHLLQHDRTTFEQDAALSVDGVGKSVIARVKGIVWETEDRWLEEAAACCRRCNHQNTRGLDLQELQASYIRTVVGDKEYDTWIFTSNETWSRLWPSAVAGRRGDRNTLSLLRGVRGRSRTDSSPLMFTDGFEFYDRVVGELYRPVNLKGQVIKSPRNGPVIKVDRELVREAP